MMGNLIGKGCLLIAIALMLSFQALVLLIWDGFPIPVDPDVVLYPLVDLSLLWSAACVFLPALTVLCGIVIWMRRWKIFFRWELVPVLMMTNLCACIALFGIGFRFNGSRELARSFQPTNAYFVVFDYNTQLRGPYIWPYVTLYECDRVGLVCKVVYVHDGERLESGELDDHPWQARLIPDDTTQTLALEVNRAIVYTHVIAR